MDKLEAMKEIRDCIDQVKDADRFEGRARVLKTLNKLYDLVALYKASGNYFELCAKEAVKLVATLKEGMNGGK